MKTEARNIAYIDGQNLYMGTKHVEPAWEIDLARFLIYLKKKYHVIHAYYYLGYSRHDTALQKLYNKITRAGFILVFKQHNANMLGKKKGNVDSDIIFGIMRKIYYRKDFDNIVLISGDGDYKPLIDFLIHEDRFEKILFPNRKYASSLYKKIDLGFRAYLEDQGVRNKIEKKKKAP